MFNRSHVPSLVHIVLRAWAIAWLLLMPLFHVHPEMEAHHGESGHIL